MTTTLSDDARAVADRVLDVGFREDQSRAMDQLTELPATEQQRLGEYFQSVLEDDEDQWRRAWSASALLRLQHVASLSVIRAHSASETEPRKWVRYWSLRSYAGFEPSDLQAVLHAALNDRSRLVGSLACRLLIEIGEEQHLDQLLKYAMSDDGDEQWFACKVFRRSTGHKDLPPHIERRILQVLRDRLSGISEWQDVQWQAASALGDFRHEWRGAIEALAHALNECEQDSVRRECISSLQRISRPEGKDALLFALRDTDAEIRVRAANALKDVLGAEEAIGFVVRQVIESDTEIPELLDALRVIDPVLSARELAARLSDPDQFVAEHARRSLSALGGDEAVRTLQAMRTKAMDVYTDLLGDADQKVMQQFDTLMRNAHAGFKLSMGMHGVIFVIGGVILAIGLAFALSEGVGTFAQVVGTGTAASSLGTLLLMFYKDPLANIRTSVTDLMKVNVVFLGYVRQINQIDATFKQLFLGSTSFSEMSQTVEEIQNTVSTTMKQVREYLDVANS